MTGLPRRRGMSDRFLVGRGLDPKVQVGLGAGMDVPVLVALVFAFAALGPALLASGTGWNEWGWQTSKSETLPIRRAAGTGGSHDASADVLAQLLHFAFVEFHQPVGRFQDQRSSWADVHGASFEDLAGPPDEHALPEREAESPPVV